MRKIGLLLVALISLSFFACSSDDNKNDGQSVHLIVGQWEGAKLVAFVDGDEFFTEDWNHECETIKDITEFTIDGDVIDTYYDEDCELEEIDIYPYSIEGNLLFMYDEDGDVEEILTVRELTKTKLVLYGEDELQGMEIGIEFHFNRK